VSHDKYGFGYWLSIQAEDAKITDNETFDVAHAKTDWEYEISDRYLIKAGFDVRSLRADYDYLGTDNIYVYHPNVGWELDRIDTVQSVHQAKGNQIGAYLSHRVKLSEPLTVEVGGRFDRHSYTDDETWSPRVNFAYQLGDNTSLRGGWGYFFQAQRIDELSPGDNMTEFFGAERAEHQTVGLEHDFGTGVRLRVEAYHKKYTDLRPEFRNTFDELQPFPEFEEDRTVVYRDQSVAQGIEVFLKREKGSKFTWWASYAYAKVEDEVDRIKYTDPASPEGVVVDYDRTFPNPYDQRHTLYLDASYRPNLKWQFNLAWNFHTGWPYTGVYLASAVIGDQTVYWVNADELLAERYPAYSRVDFRVNRYFDFWGGRLTAFFEVVNILGRENVRGYSYEIVSRGGSLRIEREVEKAFPTLPVLGVTYSLNM